MAESMKGLKRTCRCAELSEQNIGDTVTVMGWVQKQRNKGGIIFVDLRDRSGILQLIFEESEIGSEGFAKAEKLRSEFVVAVTGEVTARSGAVNDKLATGKIEVRAKAIRVLSESETPQDQRRHSIKISLFGSAQTGSAAQFDHAQSCGNIDPSIFGRRRIFRDRDTDAYQEYTGGCQRLSCAKSCASG